MKKADDTEQPELPADKIHRPFLLSVVGTAVLVFSVLVSLFFLAAILNNNWLITVLIDYFPDLAIFNTSILALTVGGFITYSTNTLAVILMLRLKRLGFYLYTASTLIIVALPYVIGFGNLISTLIFLTSILVFAFFYRKMR